MNYSFISILITLCIFGLHLEVAALPNFKTFTTTFSIFFKHKVESIIEIAGANTQCGKDLKTAIKDLMFWKRWALEMIDSSSKPTGVLAGNYFAFGNFEQCLSIREMKSDTVINGQYCTVFVTPSEKYSSEMSFMFDSIALANYSGIKTNRQTADILKQFKMTYGLCIPASCSIENLQTIWDYIEHAFMIPVHVTFKDFLCRTHQKEIEPFQIDRYIILLFFIYFGLILSITFYDIMFHHSQGAEQNIWISFSLLANFRKIFSNRTDNSNNEHLKSISGIKVLSMLWIIFGHRFLINCYSGNINSVYIHEWRQNISTTLITAGHLAVDTFFTLSGLLLSYGFLRYKMLIASKKHINFVFLYIYRFLRLGPALLATILFHLSIYKNIGDGPVWSLIAKKTALSCYHTWWMTLSFLSNIVDIKHQCVEHSWYLAVDSQLFFISPILLTYLFRRPRRTCLFCIVMCVISGLYTFAITLKNNYGATHFEGNREYFHYIYFPTFVRMPPWLIGFIFGYLITKYHHFRIKNKTLVILSWMSIILFVIFLVGIHVIFNDNYNNLISAIYNGIIRQIWSLIICSIVFLCATGHGGIINDFLSLPLFQILVKLLYSVYLIHFAVIVYFAGTKKYPEHFSNIKGIRDFMGDLLFISIIGTIWCLAFESPFISVGKILINKELEPKLSITDKSTSVIEYLKKKRK